MPDNQTRAYPTIPVKHWWSIRTRFVQSVPTQVTPGFLATTLGIAEQSARTGILPSLITLGIVDQDGKPTERAKRWRDNQNYGEVCREIREDIYPHELLESLPGPEVDRTKVERWFLSKTGSGKAHAQKMAAIYELLVKADPQPQEKRLPKSSASSGRPKKPKQVKDTTLPLAVNNDLSTTRQGPENGDHKRTQPTKALLPSFHFDIQIHISPDASPEQIDQIFGSMARHLSRLGQAGDE